jgi:hypothetical protein
MRCREITPGKLGSTQATEAVLPRGSLQRFFPAPISSPRHHDSSPEAARPIQTAPHAHHLWPLQIPSKIESAIDTHRYRHTPTV